ncbi:unnamed protein product [Phaedon cochleariae]|uniref:Uncharacterized protein n=1 Tax=Phaedon cochleariae TaxID=80249 RepID=A0A9P0D853_PHACE|nr:unnamed protein product [Phaedon cochleariae]
MIVRHIQLILAAHLIYIVTSQNARSYDTSDWVPITQKTKNDEAAPKKATGRVLNLDAPAKNFFPEDDYLYRKHRPLTPPHSKNRDRYNIPKYEDNSYKFELPHLPRQKGKPQMQYFTNQEVKLPNYEQPPPLEPYRSPLRPHHNQQTQTSMPNTRERAPAPDAASIYDKYTIPFNNPSFLNQQLLSANSYQQNVDGFVGNTPNRQQSSQAGDDSLSAADATTVEKESVQLVYVPLENLKPNQPIPQDSQAVYKQVESPRYDDKIVNNNHANQLAAIQHDFIEQALRATKLQQQFEDGQPILLQPLITTTSKPPKKRKPHQPPLAVYMEGNQPADIEDVLDILKGAKSISVQDSVQPDSPQIFIGPTSLDAPDGYSKFPLPYLNNVEGNRIEKRIESLPFFVAPLSFKTPPGYSKIPLPAPHVGSVVISNKEDPQELKRSTPATNRIKSITPTPIPFNDYSTPQTYQNQDYYNQGQLYSTPQPQLLQFNVNHNKQFPVSSGYYQQPLNDPYNLPRVVDDQRYRQGQNIHNPTFEYPTGGDNIIRTTPRYTDEPSNNHRFTTPKNQDVNIPSRTTSSQEEQTYSEGNSTNQPTITEQNHQNYETPYYSSVQNIREPNSQLHSISNTEKYNDGSENSFASITPQPIPEQEQTQKAHSSQNEQQIKTLDVNPLELAINEFELHQINSQLEEKPRVKNQYDYDSDPQTNQREQGRYRTRHRPQTTTEESQYKFDPELHRFASTPASILRDTDVETTVRPISSKSRRRGRPSRPTTTSTTTTTSTAPTEEERYTVLEEFSIKPKTHQYPGIFQYSENSQYEETPQYAKTPQYAENPQYQETPQYQEPHGNQYAEDNAENPASVYTLRTTTPSYITAKDKPSQSIYKSDETVIEDIPARVYKLQVNENSNSQAYDAPIYNENIPTYNENVQTQNQHILNQNLMDQQILQNVYRQNSQEDGRRQKYPDNSFTQQYEVQPNIEPLVHNRGQHQGSHKELNVQVIPEVNSDTDINYEDPSVRSLLVPNLLVPRAPDDDYSAPKYLPTTDTVDTTTSSTTTTTTSTTERYIETTTQRRIRGRQRGGSRYNVPTTRRTPTRRRPSHTQRTTTERSSYSEETGDSQRTSTRQRFRTRGRTTPNNISGRLSSTENDVHNGPTSESGIKYTSEPYIQFGNNVNDLQISTARPDAENIADNERHQIKSSQQPLFQYENTPTTSRQLVDVQIKHPVQNKVRTQSDNIIYKTEENPRESVKLRGRVRGRSRPVSTTTEAVTTRRPSTPVQQEEQEEEFYGFFRQPNFSQPPVHQSEQTTSSRPNVYYESTPSQTRDDTRLQYDNTREAYSTTPRFVGELVPKYQTTSSNIEREDVETPRPRIRPRTRAPHRQNSPRISANVDTESSTKNPNALRSRGRSHYKVPENLRKEREDDIEGGNYPAEFFQNKQQFTTRSPSFQITVTPDDEEEDDQVPHHSLYRPNVLARPEEWHEASQYDAGDKGQGNLIGESSDAQTTTEQPIALPIKANTEELIESSSYETTYKEASEAMEGIFEAINNKYQGMKDTTKKPISNGRRRGTWKLVKQRPVDRLEVAESQNYYSVLNSFDEIKKIDADEKISNHQKAPIDSESESQDYYSVLNSYDDLRKINVTDAVTSEKIPVVDTIQDSSNSTDSILEAAHVDNKEETSDNYPTTTYHPEEPISEIHEDNINTGEPLQETTNPIIETTSQHTKTTITEDSGFLSSLYEMLGVSGREQIWGATTLSPASYDDTETPTTTLVTPSFPEEITEGSTNTTTQAVTEYSPETTTEVDSTTTIRPGQKMPPFQVEPWEMRAVRTSTSTEVSHETEICYKGRCIKAADRKKRL